MTDYFWEVVLSEDDCAPDAREYFNREFRQYSALDVATFKSLAQLKESDDGLTLSWVLGDVELSISADDPFYIVRKRRIVSPKSDMNSTKEPSDPIRAAPAVVPIPVSERLPELDVRCWWFDNNEQWYFRSWAEINIAGLQQPTHWLPAHAIPLSQRLNK